MLVRSVDGDELRSPLASAMIPALVTSLEQNRPNPFNPQTTISFTLAERTQVHLGVYDVDGALVRTLVNEPRAAATYESRWDGRDESGHAAASGVYFYKLTAGSFTQTKKMVLLK
jgi:flagellar hook assembly protein FlgD